MYFRRLVLEYKGRTLPEGPSGPLKVVANETEGDQFRTPPRTPLKCILHSHASRRVDEFNANSMYTRLQPNVEIQAVDAPLSPAKKTAQPFQTEPSPLNLGSCNLLCSCRNQGPRGRVHHLRHDSRHSAVEILGRPLPPGSGQVHMAPRGPRLEPVASKVEEATVGPVARRQEEYEQEDGAVEAWPVQEVGADEKEEDESRRGVCRYEEEGKPTAAAASMEVRLWHPREHTSW